jgi:hypothetical protein
MACVHPEAEVGFDSVVPGPVVRWKSNWGCVTHTLAGEYVGLQEVDDGLSDAYFGPIKLGRMDEPKLRIEHHKGRWVRKTV